MLYFGVYLFMILFSFVDGRLSSVFMFCPGSTCTRNSVLRNVDNHVLHYTVPLPKFLSSENVIPYKFPLESTNTIEVSFGPMKVIFK